MGRDEPGEQLSYGVWAALCFVTGEMSRPGCKRCVALRIGRESGGTLRVNATVGRVRPCRWRCALDGEV